MGDSAAFADGDERPGPRGILITGASRGAGAATARAFAKLGDRVAVHYCADRAGADAVLASLPGDGHRVVQADLRDGDAVRAMVDQAWVGLHGIDVVVNSAQVSAAHRIGQVSYRYWQRAWSEHLAVNLVGASNLAYCAARLMIDRGAGGCIVNVSSDVAHSGEPEMPAYAASKAGLNALAASLAVALAPHGIAVSTVASGQSLSGRLTLPEEVAAAVVFLASEQARCASGTVLNLSGGS